jgi:hypothetical protein
MKSIITEIPEQMQVILLDDLAYTHQQIIAGKFSDGWNLLKRLETGEFAFVKVDAACIVDTGIAHDSVHGVETPRDAIEQALRADHEIFLFDTLEEFLHQYLGYHYPGTPLQQGAV